MMLSRELGAHVAGKLSKFTPKTRNQTRLLHRLVLFPRRLASTKIQTLTPRAQWRRAYATTSTGTQTETPAKKTRAPRKTSTKGKNADAKDAKEAIKEPAKKSKAKTAKKPAKKAMKKVKTKKKPSEAQVQTALLRRLKEEALLEEPKREAVNGHTLFVKKQARENPSSDLVSFSKEASAQWRAMSGEEKRQYAAEGLVNKEMNVAKLQEWMNRYSVERIIEANNARRRLSSVSKALKESGQRKVIRVKYPLLPDARLPRRPSSAFILFYTEKIKGGDYRGLSSKDASREASRQWKALSESEAKRYGDESKAAFVAWEEQTKGYYKTRAKPALAA